MNHHKNNQAAYNFQTKMSGRKNNLIEFYKRYAIYLTPMSLSDCIAVYKNAGRCDRLLSIVSYRKPARWRSG